jgi:phosphatidate cytidylyltransferase
MAPPAERPSSDRAGGLTNLQKRILSAAVLLPLVIAAIYFGPPYFTVLIAVFAGAAAWEWVSVAANVRTPGGVVPLPDPPAGLWRADAFVSMVAVAAIALVAGFGAAGWGVFAIVGLVILWLVLTGLLKDRQRLPWNLAGIVYVAAAAASLVLIRSDLEWGRATLIWIIALVVAADTGGYLVGRTVGGPKLAPRISPNKTWSGLGGAVAGAALAGLCTAFILNHTNVWMLTLISAVLGLLEQGGDLVESAFKRHFGVKDTSQIIPGHGGVLDRVDGLLAVAVAVLVINLWAGGSVLAW